MSTTDTTTDTATGTTMLDLDQLRPSTLNLRTSIGTEDVKRLAASVKAQGILQPLVVRPHAEQDGAYEIIAGHRRHAAATRAGLAEVPAIIRDLTDSQRDEFMLVENLQRVDLTPMEEASGYVRLVEAGMNLKTLAGRIGRSQKHISGRLRLLDLPAAVQTAIEAGDLPLGRVEILHAHVTADDFDAIAAHHDETNKGGGLLDRLIALASGPEHARVTINVDNARAQMVRDTVLEKVRTRADRLGWRVVTMRRETWGQARWPRREIAPVTTLDLPDAKAHRDEPCHALGVDETGPKPKAVEVCTDTPRHRGDGDSNLTSPPLAARQAEHDEWAEKRAQADRAHAARRAAETAAQAAAIAAATDRSIATLVIDAAAEQALAGYGYVKQAMCAVLGIDLDDAIKWTDEKLTQRLAEYAQASKTNRARLGLAHLLVAGRRHNDVDLGVDEALAALVAPHLPDEKPVTDHEG